MTPTTVVNLRYDQYDIYIGRGRDDIWGNPFSHLPNTLAEFRVYSRKESIEAHGLWIPTQPLLLAKLHLLRGQRLGCFCKPKACHGDILAELADSGDYQ